MTTLKEIREMDLVKLRILWINLYYAKAWGGQLAHVWESGERTLCGKDLLPHTSRTWHSQASGPCKICARRRKEVRDRIEEVESE